jgi:ABC-type Fe3+-hydroxamate transport system substrate-binding protein
MTYQLPAPSHDRTRPVTRRPRPVAKAALAFAPLFALAVAISACASPATGTDGNSPTSTALTAATPKPTATSDAASSGSSSSAATVSANTATTDELVAALGAAGVTNADRWAREIMEYRPYDTTDPTLQHLQDELAKYNPDPATLAKILSVLTP